MATLTRYHTADCGTCGGKTYAREGFDVPGYWTKNGRVDRPSISEGIGIEIETGTNEGDYNGASDFVNNYLEPEIRNTFDEGFFKYQDDISIRFRYRVEIISQVFTRGWYNNGGRDKLKYLFDVIFRDLEMGQNSSCGNHINISKALFYNDRSAWLFDEEITNNYYIYCRKFGREPDADGYWDNEYFSKRTGMYREEGHDTAINWKHWDEGSASRLEARIVGKASSGEEYCGYIDAILELIDTCNKKAKAEGERGKRAYIASTHTSYDCEGIAKKQVIQYNPTYTGTWTTKEIIDPKKTNKDGVKLEVIEYNSNGGISLRSREFHYVGANKTKKYKEVCHYNDEGRLIKKETDYYNI